MIAETKLIVVSVVVIVFLLLHHRYKHRSDIDKTSLQKWFQWSDVNNHETAIVLLLGFTLGVAVFLFL